MNYQTLSDQSKDRVIGELAAMIMSDSLRYANPGDSESEVEFSSVPKRYADIDFVPPKPVRRAAEHGLFLRKKYRRGGLSNKEAGEMGIGSGVQRAVNLKNGDRVSPKVIRQMKSFYARAAKHKHGSHRDGGPSAGTIAWLLWGGDAGEEWVNRVIAEMESVDLSDEPKL